jgi:hypothetical protein
MKVENVENLKGQYRCTGRRRDVASYVLRLVKIPGLRRTTKMQLSFDTVLQNRQYKSSPPPYIIGWTKRSPSILS